MNIEARRRGERNVTCPLAPRNEGGRDSKRLPLKEEEEEEEEEE